MTMIRTAVISTATNTVTNVVPFLNEIPAPLPGELWVASDTAQIGDGWNGTAIVPQPAPTPAPVTAAGRLAEISAACAAAIVGGFASSALGAPHTYPSDPTSQTNLLGSVTASLFPGLAAGWSTPFWCADASGAWSFQPHSAAQIQQVGLAAKAWVVACQTQCATLCAQVTAATSPAAIAAVVWSNPAVSA